MFIKVLKEEYLNLFPEKNNLVFLRSLLCYKRVISFRAVVLIRCFLKTNSVRQQNRFKNKLLLRYGIEIGKGCRIGKDLRFEHINGIVIGRGSVIGDHCVMYQQVTIGQKDGKYPVIGNNAVLYPGCKIIGDIHIGDNAVIGANAVVLHDVPDGAVAAGVPARIIKSTLSDS